MYQFCQRLLGLALAASAFASPALAQIKLSPDYQAGKPATALQTAPIPDGRNLKDPIESFMLTITERDLEAHLEFLASAELEGRETGERGQKLAAQYLAAQFHRMGLRPGMVEDGKATWFQTYELEKAEIINPWVSLNGKQRFEPFTDWLAISQKDLALPFQGGLAFGGFGIQDQAYKNLDKVDAKGKLLIVLNGEPLTEDGKYLLSGSGTRSTWSEDIGRKREAAIAAGATGMVVICQPNEFQMMAENRYFKNVLTHNSLRLAGGSEAFPILFVSPEMGELLLKPTKKTAEAWRNALLQNDQVPAIAYQKTTLAYHSEGKLEKITAENVLGVIEGTDKKEEVVVLTAHFDHLGIHDGQVFYGADDDGSGTVAVLEIAEAFAKAVEAGYKPRRTLLFMPVSGEEKGLLGSRYYTDHPVFPLEQTVCNLNIDMIGRVDQAHIDKRQNEYVYAIGSDRLSQDLHDASEAMAKRYSNIELDYTFNDESDPNRFYYRSDHYNFAKNNVPVIFYFTGVHPDYHKATDTEDKIQYNKMMKITRLIFATAWDAANRENRYQLK